MHRVKVKYQASVANFFLSFRYVNKLFRNGAEGFIPEDPKADAKF